MPAASNESIPRHSRGGMSGESVAENGAPKLLISDLYWDSSGWPYYG
ncbi:hypothetical protein J2Z45_003110 [Cohnella lubricantis]|nr:hypothetical protein [Cohnella lubricantis]